METNLNYKCEVIDQIKLYLTEHRISQRELARELGISKQLLSGVLTRRIRSLPVEIKLMRWYNGRVIIRHPHAII